jgi:hypothetical protein
MERAYSWTIEKRKATIIGELVKLNGDGIMVLF